MPGASDVVAMVNAWKAAGDDDGFVSRVKFMACRMFFESNQGVGTEVPEHLAVKIHNMGFKVDSESVRLREEALKGLLFDFLSTYVTAGEVGQDKLSITQAALCLCADSDVGAALNKAASVIAGSETCDVTVEGLFSILHRGSTTSSSGGQPDPNSIENVKALFTAAVGRSNKPASVAAVWAKQVAKAPGSASADGWSDYNLPDPFNAIQSVSTVSGDDSLSAVEYAS